MHSYSHNLILMTLGLHLERLARHAGQAGAATYCFHACVIFASYSSQIGQMFLLEGGKLVARQILGVDNAGGKNRG